MKSSTRRGLLIATVLTLVLVLVLWYATIPRPVYADAHTLARISYNSIASPTCGPELSCPGGTFCLDRDEGLCSGALPLIYYFSAPLGSLATDGTTSYPAFLRSFTITGVDPISAASEAADLVAMLLAGGQEGGTPFIPTHDVEYTTLATNAIPPEALGAGYPPMEIAGFGTMTFVQSEPS